MKGFLRTTSGICSLGQPGDVKEDSIRGLSTPRVEELSCWGKSGRLGRRTLPRKKASKTAQGREFNIRPREKSALGVQKIRVEETGAVQEQDTRCAGCGAVEKAVVGITEKGGSSCRGVWGGVRGGSEDAERNSYNIRTRCHGRGVLRKSLKHND